MAYLVTLFVGSKWLRQREKERERERERDSRRQGGGGKRTKRTTDNPPYACTRTTHHMTRQHTRNERDEPQNATYMTQEERRAAERRHNLSEDERSLLNATASRHVHSTNTHHDVRRRVRDHDPNQQKRTKDKQQDGPTEDKREGSLHAARRLSARNAHV